VYVRVDRLVPAAVVVGVAMTLPAPLVPAVGTTASGARLPRCARQAYRYELAKNGAQGALILDAHVGYVRGAKCAVRDQVVLRLTNGRGRLLRVRGNPVRTEIEAVVGPRTFRQTRPLLYAWRNWCPKSPMSYAFRVSSRTKSAVFRWRVGEPACVSPAQPSTLRRFTPTG